nr:hypothetical protein [uncultured archaeon]
MENNGEKIKVLKRARAHIRDKVRPRGESLTRNVGGIKLGQLSSNISEIKRELEGVGIVPPPELVRAAERTREAEKMRKKIIEELEEADKLLKRLDPILEKMIEEEVSSRRESSQRSR